MASAGISNDLLIAMGSALSEAIDAPFEMLNIIELKGGSHRTVRLETTAGTFFVKWNDAAYLPNFLAEQRGLEALRQTRTFRLPDVFGVTERENHAFLLMEFIFSTEPTAQCWESFGHRLAALHQHSSPTFGYSENNFIGLLPQSNAPKLKFVDFFVEERLRPMLRRAYNSHVLDTTELTRLEKLIPMIEKIFPQEPPALLHGDLWSGNFFADEFGNPTVIDPAVHYGHREAEIAFMMLFGGFHQYVFDAYNMVFPLERGWKSRIGIYNLYPLMVHLCLFGRQYWPPIDETLRRFKV